ncbi:D-aminoacid aminotransferase-like PLP-dependent enzyme [Pseudovirgaria hyperparasitica]|uniref:D-aminoacid aminotransferase-like PLP-dependent enzyme n=1 Tax=Pseudovirgaria hyperparasitica TaxID=470096 RepID=A0A6A6W512_9PEZI|nr:D-aminoacid aminotransferase-like PLP-dependent enzyme [Pseudovirgaria hyperparasitica]KAF2757683.1 D-aminoacid aminotransferase-like PLP-dependent enzyme [Pseudovirgaria hyperparasitica]
MATMQKVFAAYQSRLSTLQSTYPSNRYAAGIACIDNTLVPLADARIPITDQGFLKSDLTYDVPAIWDGRFFRLDDHLDRFERSCSKMRYKSPLSREELKAKLIEMAALSGMRDVYVHIIVTRGMLPAMLVSEAEQVNNLYIIMKPYYWVMAPEMQIAGTGAAVITKTVSRTPEHSVDPTVKNHQWGDFTRGVLEARDRGAKYPFLTDGQGALTEGPGYNIVLVNRGVLYTPASGVLEGVTRLSVMDVAREKGVEARVERVPVKMAYSAEEIFMCTTAGGIMPITELDGKPVGDGLIGPVTKTIWDAYWEMHYNPNYSFEISYEFSK